MKPTGRSLLAHAVRLIERERRIIVRDCTDPKTGVVDEEPDRAWLASYDRFLKPARAWLKRAKR